MMTLTTANKKTSRADEIATASDLVYRTTNYGQFKTLKGNRVIEKGHIAKLTGSIFRKNLLAQNPIIVNSKMEVIDGQHRLLVAKNNSLEISYMVISNASIREVQLLNANAKPWTYRDYLESYTSLGYEDYIKLGEFAREYDLPLSVATQLLGETAFAIRKAAQSNRNYKEGAFKVLKWDEAHELMDKVYNLNAYTNFKSYRDASFLRAVQITIVKELYELLLEKLEKKEVVIRKEALVKHYLRAFEDVLNFGQHKNKYRLY